MQISDLTTYQAALLQSRVHRAMKNQYAHMLKSHGMTTMQWSILGLVADAGDTGMRISDLAHAFDTSLAFITTSVNVLEAKGMVQREHHSRDNRAKVVRLNQDVLLKVQQIEKELQAAHGRHFFKDVSVRDVATYFKVLDRIAKRTDTQSSK